MTAEDVRILKQSGIIAVRHANDNLRMPGFKRLEHCDTTVDMDQDPEVFMMLEPVIIVRSLNKATPNVDMRTSARRLRFIFRAAILFFEWRLPNGETMLRENGIRNLPDEVFDEIKTALAKSDRHFSRFSAMAIKRCLQLFTENVLDQAHTALPTEKGDTTTTDLARETWEAVKHFQAMLSQDWSTIARPSNSMTTVVPPAAGQSSRNVQQLFTSHANRPSSSFAETGTGGGSAFATQGALTAATTTRGGGGPRPRATTSRRGATLPPPGPSSRPNSGASTLGRGRGGSSSWLNCQDAMDLDGPFSPTQAMSSLTMFERNANPGARQSTPSALGKHKRAEPDLDETKESRPTASRKHEHVESKAKWTQFEGFHINKDVDLNKALQEQRATMRVANDQLARDVLALRERVRNLEKEKDEALAEQRRQLRPGLVTMKMSPRVQARVNKLFGSTDNVTGSKPVRSGGLTPASQTVPRGRAAVNAWLKDVDDDTPRKSIENSAPSMPNKRQESIKTGPGLPPVGHFRHPRSQKSSSTPESKNSNKTSKGKGPVKKPSKSKRSKSKRWNTKTRELNVDDSGEESEVPTESSWASDIPA